MKWGDLITLEYGKAVKDKDRLDGSTPVYGTNGKIGTSNLPPLCPFPSFILGRKGAYRGVHFSDIPFSVIDTAFYAKPKSNLINIKWAYYKFLTYDIHSMDSGSAIPSTDRYEIYKINLDLPSITIQNIIVKILETIDKKISINNKINENLEKQAAALFKSWFVDFEPWDGLMPDGWRYGNLSEICSYSKSKILVSDLNINTYYSTENILPNKQGVVISSGLPTVRQVTQCKPGDTLVSNIRPYFKKILYCHQVSGCSNDVLCLRPTQQKYSNYLYAATYRDEFFDFMMSGAKGTKMPRGDKNQIMTYPIIIPSNEQLTLFNEITSKFYQAINVNKQENLRLAEIRDTLLPKLMSGEIDVSDIDI